MDGNQALDIITGNAPISMPRGRPTRREVIGLQRLKARLEKQIAKNADKIAGAYVAFAQTDPPTTRHAVDRVLPIARPDLSPGEAVLIAGVSAILTDYLRPKQPNNF